MQQDAHAIKTESVESETGDQMSSEKSDLSRRRFLQGAALAGGSVILPSATLANATTAGPEQSVEPAVTGSHRSTTSRTNAMNNPVVKNFSGPYGASVPDFQIPKRPMGKTGLQVSILGVGGYHIGTVAGQDEVNNMIAKALDSWNQFLR